MIRAIARIAALAALLAPPALAKPVTVRELTIDRAQLGETPAGASVAGGYLLVTNAGEEDDRLLAAASDRASVTQLHEMRMDGDVMRMRELEGGLVVPAGGACRSSPAVTT